VAGEAKRSASIWCCPTTARSRQSARLRSGHRARSERCAPPAAEAERWADDGLTARGKTFEMIRLPRWLPSSPALTPVAPRGSLIGSSGRGGSPHRVLRTSARPRAVGRQQSGPSSDGTVRSAGADLRLGGLQSGLLVHALGDVRGGRRGLRRHAGLHGRHGAGHRCRRIDAVSIWLPLSNHAVQRTPGARILRDTGSVSGGAPGAADGERWADDGLTARGKTLKMIRLPGWLPSSLALAPVAPRGSLVGSSGRGGSPHRVLRKSARPRAMGKRQSGPSSYGTVRSAGADLRLGGLQSGLLGHALGDMRGGTRGLRRHPGLHGRHGAVHRRGRIGAVSIWLPLSNHAVQRTPGARILRDTGSVSGGAPGAADGERYAHRWSLA